LNTISSSSSSSSSVPGSRSFHAAPVNHVTGN
jgi:hypothetical protein